MRFLFSGSLEDGSSSSPNTFAGRERFLFSGSLEDGSSSSPNTFAGRVRLRSI